MSVLVVTGTGTGVGKTVVTAALAALAATRGSRVAVVKPAQTGTGPTDPGDLDDVRRLAGVTDLHEDARFPDPLSPAAAARNAGRAALDLGATAREIQSLATDRDLVVVEGAGGLLVRYDDDGATLAGVVLGTWPADPDLACRSNVRDLEMLSARPLSGAMPADAGRLDAADFRHAARAGLGPDLGGVFDAADFRRASDRAT